MHTVTLHYTEPLIRRAVRASWWRNTGWMFFLILFLLAGAVGVGLYAGERSWWIGLMGTVLGIVSLLAATVYLIHMRGSLARFRRMENPVAVLDLDEERFRISSDVGTSEMTWNVITEIWCYPEFWLVFFSRAQFVTLPTAEFDEGSREFFLAKGVGAKVVENG